MEIKMKKKILVGMLAAVLMLCAGCIGKAESASVPRDMFVNLDTIDFEGNEVTASLFKENDLTLINTWATWCGPCVGEIPELNELPKELKEEGKSVGIKGLVIETEDRGIHVGLTEAERKNVQEVLDATGADYQQLLVSEDLAESALSKQAGFPTTYFVDSDGMMVGDPVTGAEDKDGWRKIIDERLEKVKNEK